MKMKDFAAAAVPASVFALPSENSDTKRLFQENPLARGLPFCGFRLSDSSSSRFIAVVLKADQSLRLVDGMTDVLAAWRLAFRMHDIQESRVSILDKRKNDIDEISPEVMQNLVSLVGSWSFELGPRSSSSVQDSIMSGSSSNRTTETEALNDFSASDFVSLITAVDNFEEPVGRRSYTRPIIYSDI